ncbi:MAG: hypothetical protein HYR85_12245 [Planctomycetes bacterium]|nr:hypothetical protein [Planctomycetota bacterium]
MNHPALGMICGLAFGVVVVALMMPMTFPDKRAALLAAFVNRFAVGFLIPNVSLPLPEWLIGLGVALVLSIPDAIITKALVPIVGIGALGGLVIGFVTQLLG